MKTKVAIVILLHLFFLKDVTAQTLINNLQQLQLYAGSDYIHLKGYTTPGDYGNGYFVLKNTSLTANGGTIFNSPISSKKWFRVYKENINSQWFKTSTSISDKLALSRAIEFASTNNETLYIPSGEYNLSNDFIFIKDKKNLKIIGNGDKTIFNVSNVNATQSVFKIENSSNITISNIKIKGNRATGISLSKLSKNINLSKITFEGINDLNHCIYLFDTSDINITECVFINTGYQIIQRFGFSSNNVFVDKCVSQNCKLDFVELNSEASAPSKNWVITNNIVKNLGTSSSTTKTESRFIGITNTDGVIINNNVIEDTAGDATFHFEGLTGKVIVTNNIIKNPHGKFGRLIFNVGGTTVNSSNRHITFSNNYIEINKKFNGDADRLIYSSDVDATRMTIRDNIFINNSTDSNLKAIVKAETKEFWNITGNEFKNFNSVITLGKNAGHTYVGENHFNNSKYGIVMAQTADKNSTISVENNSFKNVDNVYNDPYRKVEVVKFTGNIIDGSLLDLNLDLLQGNRFTNSNVNYKDYQVVKNISKGVKKQIFKINSKNYNMLCWVEFFPPGSADSVKDLVRISRNLMYSNVYGNKIEIISRHRTGLYPEPIYSIDENGINVIINGLNRGPFKTKVKVIDIEN